MCNHQCTTYMNHTSHRECISSQEILHTFHFRTWLGHLVFRTPKYKGFEYRITSKLPLAILQFLHYQFQPQQFSAQDPGTSIQASHFKNAVTLILLTSWFWWAAGFELEADVLGFKNLPFEMFHQFPEICEVVVRAVQPVARFAAHFNLKVFVLLWHS